MVKQIVMYIDIVEAVTGKPWDSDYWKVDAEMFNKIRLKVNGTYGDKTRLECKTRADIPEKLTGIVKILGTERLAISAALFTISCHITYANN